MRIILRLRATKSQEINNESHKLQGFVYDLIRRSGFPGLHEKSGYKFFCFSGIFPQKSVAAGDMRNFIISSPSSELVKGIGDCLRQGEAINIGEMQFQLSDFSVFEVRLGEKPRVECSTPVIVRIPEKLYDRYCIPLEERKRRYVYWRPKYPFEAFLKQVSENLIKKYNDFYGTEIQTYDLFEQFVFRKQVNLRFVVEGRSYGAAGSLWEFLWTHMDAVQRKIIEFGLDTGFGERNSLGFGFVNVG
ncbi:MAG: CRISPR-associated endoribonuclease Cas6 [Thermoplasmata archaeon]|nr:CRISPR-associated endoribonuclease Cas6 [Thermoplasmata archaeon]